MGCCALASAESVGRFPDSWRPTSRAAPSSMVSNHEGGPGTAIRCLICGGSSEEGLRAGPGLGGRGRMSGIKKTRSLGHCPIRSTDLRRSPGLSLSLLLPQSINLAHINVGWGWRRGWTSSTRTWT